MPKRNERKWWCVGTWNQIAHLQTSLLRNNFFLPICICALIKSMLKIRGEREKERERV